MDRVKLGKAVKLLAKAEASTFDPESVALAERAYRMIAEVLNAVESEKGGRGGPPRRERRNLRERRASRRGNRGAGGRENRSDAATSYRLRSGRQGPPSGGDDQSHIDLTA